ncbi:MAG: hypothetical protein K2G60_01950, partial [Oscillospiraceae bacterium]|nr:hypothetical protein [Oscillospiraceae bacterium]
MKKTDNYFKKCITFGRAAEGLRADFQEQLKELQSEIGFEYIRFHGLFHDDVAVYDEDENGIQVSDLVDDNGNPMEELWDTT